MTTRLDHDNGINSGVKSELIQRNDQTLEERKYKVFKVLMSRTFRNKNKFDGEVY